MAPNDSAAVNDSFSVLLRYADANGEKLICKHAATAAGIAERTAYKRISKAKDSLSGEPDKGAGAEAFTILLQYAESSGSQLNVKAVSKATGLAERTVYKKVKQAREELEANSGTSGAGGDQAGDSGKEEDALKSPTKRSPTKKKSPTKKSVKKEESAESDAGDSGKEEGALKSPTKKSPAKKSPTKKSPTKKSVKKEEEDEEVTETDVVESPRQTRSRGVKRKNYAAMDADDESQVDDAEVEKAGRGGRKTGKKVKTEEEDGEFEAGVVEEEETGVAEGADGGKSEGEEEVDGGDIEKEAEKDGSAVKDEEA